MTYSDAALKRMESDPELARRYYWRVAMNARLMASKNRAAKRVGRHLPYDSMDADVLERFADSVLSFLAEPPLPAT